MAMRLRGGGADPKQPPRTIIGRVYEQFKTISEWRQEDDHDSLLVYLPGFQKEFMKITTEYPNILRVRGECLVVGNKWNRFQEDFEVPKTCKMSGIRAKFDSRVLTVTMPEKIIDASNTTATLKSREPMKREKQDTDSSKPSSSTLDITRRPQPPTAPNPDGLQPPLDRAEKREPVIEKITKAKESSKKTEEMINKLEEYTQGRSQESCSRWSSYM